MRNLRRLDPGVSQLGYFVLDSSVSYVPCYFLCPITPMFSDFENIGLKYSFENVFQNCHYFSRDIYFGHFLVDNYIMLTKILLLRKCHYNKSQVPTSLRNVLTCNSLSLCKSFCFLMFIWRRLASLFFKSKTVICGM